MNRFRDIVRFALISPEFLAALLPFWLVSYFSSLADVLIKPMKDGLVFGLGAVTLTLGMLAFNYKEGFDLLSPVGTKKILLDWPDYRRLKDRVIATMVWCILGAGCALLAVGMVATNTQPRLGIVLLLAGIGASATSTATMGLARFAIREIIRE